MRYQIIIPLFSLIILNTVTAQEGHYGKFDFEAGLEIPLAAASQTGKSNTIVPGFHIEGRWQLRQRPIDVGFHIGLSVIERKFDGDHEDYRTTPILAIADYQFGRGSRFNPYAGIGTGIAMNTITNHSGSDRASFIVSPRVGIRCFKFLNASLGYHLTAKDYSRLYFNLGFYF